MFSASVGGDSCLCCVHLVVRQTERRWIGKSGNEKLLRICNPFIVEYLCDTDNRECLGVGWLCKHFLRKRDERVFEVMDDEVRALPL